MSALPRTPGGAGFLFRLARLAVPLAAALAGAPGRGETGGPWAPLPVGGLAGVTFLTADPAALRRFYGGGAGFAEVPAAPGAIRFAVGKSQWIEFQSVPAADWPRRLQYVTFWARDLSGLEGALRARHIPTQWIGSDAARRTLQVTDPAGNPIRLEAPPASVATSPGPGFSDHLQHFGFAVARSSAAAAMAFYRDTLGWPEAFRMDGADGRLDLVKYRPPGGQGELVELIFYDPPLNKWAAGAFDHVNFEVGDIDGAYRALHRGGIADGAKARPEVNGEHLWAINLFDPELTRIEIQVLAPAQAAIGTVSAAGAPGEEALFDRRTLAGWEGNTENWRVEDGAIVAGALDRRQPHNEFLATTATYGNFDLSLQYKVEGTDGFVNGGVQFWSQRVPGNFEVSGYQADLGADTDGNLYDESRRNRNLAEAPKEVRARVLKAGAWNDYRVRAEGAHIQIWLNGERTVDYTETDLQIPRQGRFALQIHGGAKTKVSYRGLTLQALPASTDAGR